MGHSVHPWLLTLFVTWPQDDDDADDDDDDDDVFRFKGWNLSALCRLVQRFLKYASNHACILADVTSQPNPTPFSLAHLKGSNLYQALLLLM